MPRISKPLECTPEEITSLQAIVHAAKSEQRMVERARIVLACIGPHRADLVGKELGVRACTVSKWRERFRKERLQGLQDAPRPGRSSIYDIYGLDIKDKILAKLAETPPDGQARWDGPHLAKALGLPVAVVWKVTRQNNIQLSKLRSWCVSKDPNFEEKQADVIGLYLNPPPNSRVLCTDEKPSIQAIERETGYAPSNGKLIRAEESTYVRHGTKTLMAIYDVGDGKVFGHVTDTKTRVEFLSLLDGYLASRPSDEKVTYHIIMDNFCTHKNCDNWLKTHPNVVFHYTPTHASWMNMMEIWFNIFTRQVLKGASFASTEILKATIEKYIAAYNRDNHPPFRWRKREVKGCELRNTIANLAA